MIFHLTKNITSKMNSIYQILVIFPAIVQTQDSPEVCNNQGTCYKGSWLQPEIVTFQGIRYAEPPIGENRFKPPIPLNQNDLGTIDASEISSVKCLQNSLLDPTSIIGQEDCLLLNIYIPKNAIDSPSEKVPVMFYIHGGAMIMGIAEFVVDFPENKAS